MLFRSEIGVLPQLDRAAATLQPLQPELPYMLRPELGVAPLTHSDAPLSGRTLAALQRALDDGDLAALQGACLAALPALKITLRQWLHYHLGAARLRTREVMIASQQWAEQPAPPAAAPAESPP